MLKCDNLDVFFSSGAYFSPLGASAQRDLLTTARETPLFKGYLGRLPLVRTGRPDWSIFKECSPFNQHCPARSVYFYIACIAVMGFERKLSKESYFIFKMAGPTAQFGLLVSALSFSVTLLASHRFLFRVVFFFFFPPTLPVFLFVLGTGKVTERFISFDVPVLSRVFGCGNKLLSWPKTNCCLYVVDRAIVL